MAIGWFTVLAAVPWKEVIENAPKVADGAKKLWHAVAKKSPRAELPPRDVEPILTDEARAVAEMELRVAAAEAKVSELHGQMLASSELIKALAEQNAQLINRIETNRIRVVWLTAGTSVIFVIAIVGLVLTVTTIN
jgi:ribonuclease D